ncbi:halocin C8-like domain-containing protein [Halapricum salinum]|uniref:Halocin C8 n=1 Tax=Halapricum salinum TaxID=1457250 RepID=A0A4D6HFK7_9EURY|nr:halocin C8-like domain-containing protein [Halapricum salinum]QCC51842.1 hypothetical protein DV733_11610 [Halapricum salinum]
MGENNINRRSVLKATGSSVGSVGLLGAVGREKLRNKAGFADKTAVDPKDVEVTWNNSQTETWLDSVRGTKHFEDMVETIRQDGFEPNWNATFAGDVSVGVDELDETDPKYVMLPFRRVNDTNSKQKTGGGFLHLLVADDQNGDRQPVAQLGTATAPDAPFSTSSSARTVGFYSNGNAAEGAEPSEYVPERTKVQDISGTMNADISCDSCKAIAGALCNAGGLGMTASKCFEIGAGCMSGGPWFGFGCFSACASIAGTISIFGCYYGVDFICDEVGFC